MRYSEGLAMPGVSNMASMWRHEEKRTNEGPRVVYITEKAALQHAQNTTFGLFAAADLFRLTGWFHIHLFYLSKVSINRYQAGSKCYKKCNR